MPEQECEYIGCHEPALEESEYCIYHKPDKSEEEAREFYHRIRREAREPEGEIVEDEEGKKHRRWVFEKEVDWAGYHFPKIPSTEEESFLFSFKKSKFAKKVSLSFSVFTDSVSFQEATFNNKVDLGCSTFEHSAIFLRCDFKKKARFNDARFEEGAYFAGSRFYEGANFGHVEFKSRGVFIEALFEGSISFEGTKFCSEVLFGSTNFRGEADFIEAEFRDTAVFNNAEFEGITLFKEAQLLKNALFQETLFTELTDFSGTLFDGEVTFDDSRFSQEVKFGGSEFQDKSSFVKAKFRGDALFNVTQFDGETLFDKAKFKAKAEFRNTIFKSKADFFKTIFKKKAEFTSSWFEGEVWFGEAQFVKDANFHSALFKEKSSFANASYEKSAIFTSANFMKKAVFRESNIEGEAVFNKVVFLGVANFNAATLTKSIFISSVFKKDGLFRYTTFKGPAVFTELNSSEFFLQSLNNMVEEEIATKYPENCVDLEMDFSGSIFEIAPTFLKSKFQGKLYFKNTNFGQGIDIIDVENFDESNEKSTTLRKHLNDRFNCDQAKLESCRVQRISYENEGKKEEADQVYVHEMRARRETKNSQLRQSIDWFVADWTCKYGTSWQRVLLRSGQFVFGFAFLYWYFSIISLTGVMRPYTGTLISNGESIVTQQVISLFTGLGNSLYHSIITFTTIGYGDLNPSGLLTKIVSGVESAIGALFVALIIVVFARKWMRR